MSVPTRKLRKIMHSGREKELGSGGRKETIVCIQEALAGRATCNHARSRLEVIATPRS